MNVATDIEELAHELGLSALLAELRKRYGGYALVHHWTQGEFHHDLVVRVDGCSDVLVVSTNCNGGVKELLSFESVPDRWALWHWRCPDNPDFSGELPRLHGRATTVHWFDPCEILADDARSEIKPEYRRRARGGGWELREED